MILMIDSPLFSPGAKLRMDMWHTQQVFKNHQQRQISLLRFINFYNTVNPNKGINGMIPYEKLYEHFYGVTKL